MINVSKMLWNEKRFWRDGRYKISGKVRNETIIRDSAIKKVCLNVFAEPNTGMHWN